MIVSSQMGILTKGGTALTGHHSVLHHLGLNRPHTDREVAPPRQGILAERVGVRREEGGERAGVGRGEAKRAQAQRARMRAPVPVNFGSVCGARLCRRQGPD